MLADVKELRQVEVNSHLQKGCHARKYRNEMTYQIAYVPCSTKLSISTTRTRGGRARPSGSEYPSGWPRR